MCLQVSIWMALSPACSEDLFSLAQVEGEREDYFDNNQLFLRHLGRV